MLFMDHVEVPLSVWDQVDPVMRGKLDHLVLYYMDHVGVPQVFGNKQIKSLAHFSWVIHVIQRRA